MFDVANHSTFYGHTFSKGKLEGHFSGEEKDLRDVRPSCQTDEVEGGSCHAQSEEEKLGDYLRRGEEWF